MKKRDMCLVFVLSLAGYVVGAGCMLAFIIIRGL